MPAPHHSVFTGQMPFLPPAFFIFWKIIDNILEMVQDIDIVTMDD